MPTILTPTPDTMGDPRRTADDSLCHVYCEDCLVILCSGAPEPSPGLDDCAGCCNKPDCAVCDDLDPQPCVWCGAA